MGSFEAIFERIWFNFYKNIQLTTIDWRERERRFLKNVYELVEPHNVHDFSQMGQATVLWVWELCCYHISIVFTFVPEIIVIVSNWVHGHKNTEQH